MILFYKDWANPSNYGPDGEPPICDLNTTNKTFLDYASLLHQMGIKNWAFPLALHDRKLLGVNPHGENLTDEQKYRIGIELTQNPWYYLREVALVPPPAGSDPVRFRAHRANIGMFWLFMNNISFFLLQPRQTGKSVVADMLNNYLLHYRTFNTKNILFTLNQKLLTENIERIKLMRDLLPKYTIAITDKDTKAKELYTYPARNNRLITILSQSSEAAANNAGRGCTTPILQYDEGAFINYMDVVWVAASGATGAAREIAKERDQTYGTMVTTTAGDKMSRSGKFMYDIYKGSAPWTEHYFDLSDREELHRVVIKNSKDGDSMVAATFNHLQLGYTDEWLYNRIKGAHTTDQDKINRDYFNIWTAGGALSPLSPEVTKDILQSEKHPDYIQITKDGYIVKWYVPEEQISQYMRENHCIIGADTSDVIGRDATSFVAINITTLEVVFTMSINEADVIKLANFISDLMIKYNKTTLIIERKSTASTFIETLYTQLPQHGIDPFRRIFNDVIQNKESNEDIYRMVNDVRFRRNPLFYTQNKRKFGFNTTSSSRHVLFKEVLQLAAKRCRHHIYDKELSGELRSLEVDSKTGRIDHSADKHDDNVIAWLLTMWLLMYGKNLSYYGIESRRVMARVQNDGVVLDDTQVREQKLIEAYQADIERLLNKLAENENSIYRITIEHQLKQINHKLANLGVEVKNIDGMLLELKDKKKTRMLSRRSMYG